ncbi:hypothetical protein [Aquibium sp. ELW1220]|uniref:hypothetical protein n=1 Tax=Aquibium sp. ELW1220 TaxID=2976766 RepID=UPI0025B24E09|nr:hypothetical protein [Aquibium sp. ELW1220]MDN2579939.1 hypothetical protein [Aquibium sp. ELW1220]
MMQDEEARMKDEEFDALLRQAIDMPTDETALKRALAARLAASGGRTPGFSPARILTPRFATAFAALAITFASASGYGVAALMIDDELDVALMRLATGNLGLAALMGDETL